MAVDEVVYKILCCGAVRTKDKRKKSQEKTKKLSSNSKKSTTTLPLKSETQALVVSNAPSKTTNATRSDEVTIQDICAEKDGDSPYNDTTLLKNMNDKDKDKGSDRSIVSVTRPFSQEIDFEEVSLSINHSSSEEDDLDRNLVDYSSSSEGGSSTEDVNDTESRSDISRDGPSPTTRLLDVIAEEFDDSEESLGVVSQRMVQSMDSRAETESFEQIESDRTSYTISLMKAVVEVRDEEQVYREVLRKEGQPPGSKEEVKVKLLTPDQNQPDGDLTKSSISDYEEAAYKADSPMKLTPAIRPKNLSPSSNNEITDDQEDREQEDSNCSI